jgi:hypothetical protein
MTPSFFIHGGFVAWAPFLAVAGVGTPLALRARHEGRSGTAVTWEAVSALATVCSAAIVAVAAIAAVVQIRHLRAGNQLEAILRIYAEFNSAEMVLARKYCLTDLPRILADDTARAALIEGETDPRLLLVGNFATEVGALLVDGFIDERLVWPLVPLTARIWSIVEPVAQEWRRRREDPVWADFEYLAALGERVNRARHIARFPAWFRRRLLATPETPDA